MTLEPALFRPEAIDEESKQLIEQLRAMAASMPPIYTQTPADVRAARAKGVGPGGQPIVYSENAILRSIPGPGGDIPLRCFIPERIEGAYLYIHGGGWVLGTNDSSDARLEGISNTHNLAVFSVDYRLAPEHPYPAGPDDCEAAALWLSKAAKDEFGTDNLLIAGDSAGAHLAVVSLLRLRDRHGITPYTGAVLGYGVYDPDGTPSAVNWGDEAVILSTPAMQWFADHFVPKERRRDPDVNPLLADLRGMPAALFTVGTMDPLLDDSLFMHARWVSAGNEGELDVHPGGVHGLTGFPTAVGRRALAKQDDFIKRVVTG
jgi:acetyl esterase/lipase